jgi:hypothetical protein
VHRPAVRLFLLPLAVAAALASAAVAWATTAQQRHAPRAGLYGHVTIGPLAPVCRVGMSCDGPAPPHTRLLFVRRGHVVARTRTKADSTYRIALRPGRYTIRSKVGMGVVKPPVVRVVHRRFIRVDLSIDTGIR